MNAADLDPSALPPHSKEAEESVLGSLLLDGSAWARVRDVVKEGDFYVQEHRILWGALSRLLESGQPADTLTAAEALRQSGQLDAAGGLTYLQALAAVTPSAANAAPYARIVAEHSRRRELAAIGESLRIAAITGAAPADELRQKIEERLADFREHSADALAGTLDLEALAVREPDPPRSLMEGLPVGYATLLAGHGGAGKSQIALYLATCIAAGLPFFGLAVERRMVRFLSCEDREAVLHWRLHWICRHLGIDMASLRGWLELVDCAGRDMVLWRPDPRGSGTVTAAHRQVREMMRRGSSEVLFIDGVSQTFGGNENDRFHAQQFVTSLLPLIPSDRGALVLTGHVNKVSARGAEGSEREGYSGSTGWHNAVRGRWYLRHESKPGDDGERAERTGALLLELNKVQYGGGEGLTLRFEWDESAHLFAGRLEGGPSRFDRGAQDREEARGVLESIKACAEAGVTVPAALQGPRTAFHVLSVRPEFPASLKAGGAARRRFLRQLEGLRQLGAICEVEYRRTNRHPGTKFDLTPEGMRQCAE